MNILFHCNFTNHKDFYNLIKKKIKNHKIHTSDKNINYQKIDIAIVWNLPNQILKELTNLKVIFSLGAGVDHILKLKSYQNTPIIRIKDPDMRKKMFNHALSQILNYQLKLSSYYKAQQKQIWLDGITTLSNNKIKIGIMGTGYIGSYVGKKLQKLDYQVVGFKNSIQNSITTFPVLRGKEISDFIKNSDILVSILPSTNQTNNLINTKFLKKMKKKSLLINIGRGSSINEEDLIKHLNSNKNFYVSLDVFKKEPLSKNHKFWKHPNVTITPHIAAITDAESAIDYIYERLSKFVKLGKIKSDVNLENGY
tara:strand:+ start:1252 stop:2181 length:930 start_codon:yes stop_codon:yes gene_type:complete